MNIIERYKITILQNQLLKTNSKKDNIFHYQINIKIIFDNSVPVIPA